MLKIDLIDNPDAKPVEIKPDKFPDGTQLIRVDLSQLNNTLITWAYESEQELVTLIYLVKYVREYYKNGYIGLYMPYIPNARFDRVNNPDEVFTLKYFAEIINSLNFNRVFVLDAHSNVSLALINRVEQVSVKPFINTAISEFKPDVLLMPDEGAHKRYSKLSALPSTFGIKTRDWRTGDIKDYFLAEPELVKGKRVLIVDDISSKGGTFYYASKLLKENGAMDVGLYVTHCEKTITEGKLLDENSNIEKIYTADPLWHDKSNDKLNKIEVIKTEPLFTINTEE